jgi:acetyl esterase/lipase
LDANEEIAMKSIPVALLLLFAAQDKKPSPLVGPIEYLWPNGAPHAVGEEGRDKPSLSVYLAPAEKANGTAVVVCPGGGYGFLAVGHEGHDVATWWNEQGVHAFVLQYRIAPRYRHPCPMLDVQRAIRTVRARAAEWKVDPAKIGVMGFSAGGHLASTAVTHFDDGKADAEDPVERAGCRPDFGVLVYPVIAFGEPFGHKGSQKNLLGDKAEDPELVKFYSTEKQVTARTPPVFLMHTTEDRGVPAENSIVFYQACVKAKVPAELHIYEKGAHGVGLGRGDPRGIGPKAADAVLSTWPDRLAAWLRVRGVLTK